MYLKLYPVWEKKKWKIRLCMSDTIGSYGVTYFLIVHRLGELLVAYL
jgi:hypothetical protein